MRLLQKGFCFFGSQADVAIPVFREVSEDTMFLRLRSLLKDSCPGLLVASSAALFLWTRGASGPNDSWRGVVGNELLPESTDNPGTTRG